MNKTIRSWVAEASRAAGMTVLTAYALVFSEWLFFVTKPSFLLSAGFWDQAWILVVVPWILAIPAMVISLAGALLTLVVSRPLSNRILALGAAVLASVLLMLLADNFTYTLFSIRIYDLLGFGRILYALALVALAFLLNARMAGWLANERFGKGATRASVILALLTTLFVLTSLPGEGPSEKQDEPGESTGLPNIIIFSADGLDIRRLSAFGYARATTPFLEKILDRGLVFENSFTNSATTTGSIGALLTGRLPTTTRVNFRPDLYRDEDAYRHLPGILRTLGYNNAEMTVRYYVDAADFNLRQAFHWANGRTLDDWVPTQIPQTWLRAWNFEIYFWQQIWDRIRNRLLHLAGLVQYEDPYKEVTSSVISGNQDSDRLKSLREFIGAAPEPFFINTHFLVTHGAEFSTATRHFSQGKKQSKKWMTDFYDDALLDFDLYLRFLFEYLESLDKLDNTLVVLTTDHGERSKENGSEQRLPLVFFFPGGEQSGRSSINAQRIDIAPTLLDYLGVAVPEWMEGDSLLTGSISPTRLILGTGSRAGTNVGKYFEIPDVKPPLYTLENMYMIQCQRYWRLNLRSGAWKFRQIDGHTAPCGQDELLGATEAKQYLIDHLIERGYPASALKKAAESKPPVLLPLP